MGVGSVWGLRQLVPRFTWGPTTIALPAAGTSERLLIPDNRRVLLIVSTTQIVGAAQLVRVQSIGVRGMCTIGVLTQFRPSLAFTFADFAAVICGEIVGNTVGGMPLTVEVTEELLDEGYDTESISEGGE